MPSVASPEPASEPSVGSESPQLSLKVRTLDHKTYPITIGAAASVPQLKELVAVETGVTLARQRLIYRGRVLKNDQTLASYSLEDGHVLHLVARAAGESHSSPATETQRSEETTPRRQERASRRDNDDPDPTMGRAGVPSRVLMGATISVPEGTDVTMPFLSSMIANLVNQVTDNTRGDAVDGVRTADGPPPRRRPRSTERDSRRRSSSSDERHTTLRQRTGRQLDSMRATLDDSSLDFPVQLTALAPEDTNAAMLELQQQVEMLLTLLERFGPRVRLLPAALAQRARLTSQDLSSLRPVVRAIEALQAIGETADLLARMARHAFVHQPVRSRLSRRVSSETPDAMETSETSRRTRRNNTRQVHVALDDPSRAFSFQTPPLTTPVATGTSADATGDAMPSTGAHISISGVGLPLMSSVVFPFSLAANLGGRHATTTWNVADFISRVALELPLSLVAGILRGDLTQLHLLLARLGFALFSGVDVPRVTRANIRTWTHDFMTELRRLLTRHQVPTQVLELIVTERRAAFGEEVLSMFEQLVPDLVGLLVRATSASPAAAFGRSSAALLRSMMRRLLRQLRDCIQQDESMEDNDDRFALVLRGIFKWLGLTEYMASCVVEGLFLWTEIERPRARRRRPEAEDTPAIKRRRG